MGIEPGARCRHEVDGNGHLVVGIDGAQRAEVSRNEVNLADAKRDYERKQMLVEKGFISVADRDKAQAVYNAAQEQVKTARAQLAVAEAQAKNAEAVVKQRESQLAQAKVDLDRTIIRPPDDGVVTKRSVDAGQTVAASLQAPTLFVIANNLAKMQIDANVAEAQKVLQGVTDTKLLLPWTLKIDGKAVELSAPHEFIEKEGRLILQLNRGAGVELSL